MRNASDVELAVVDNRTSVAMLLSYDDKISTPNASIQVALLYTTMFGERRIRVHNLLLRTCSTVADTFRGSELDPVINVLLKVRRRCTRGRLASLTAEQTDMRQGCTHYAAPNCPGEDHSTRCQRAQRVPQVLCDRQVEQFAAVSAGIAESHLRVRGESVTIRSTSPSPRGACGLASGSLRHCATSVCQPVVGLSVSSAD